MIKDINIAVEGLHEKLNPKTILKIEKSKGEAFVKVSIDFLEEIKLKKLYLEIEFEQKPVYWRASDYTWKDFSTHYLTANYHSPKVLKFEADKYVAAMNSEGCWEWSHKRNKLIWHLIHPDLQPSFAYNHKDTKEWVQEVDVPKGQSYTLKLYFGSGPIPEIARTPIGFIPTVTFTDHCDFDTLSLLSAQRYLFKSKGIRVTKGFFLHTYSHRGEYAAMDQEEVKEEFKKWEKDGHELAYHALSRSFREESWNEFRDFNSPVGIKPISTYIDHGFLDYNFTKQPPSKRKEWLTHMSGKGINLIWNYVDCIEANALSNNQLSSLDSSISIIKKASSFQKKNKLPEEKRRKSKTWLAYGTSENLDKRIKEFNEALRPTTGSMKPLNIIISAIALLPAAFDAKIWKRNLFENKRPFKFARFSPVFFKTINQNSPGITLFQTISVKNFTSVFSRPSINKLKEECGLLIAHTYFAYLGSNHPGRIFLDEEGTLNPTSNASLDRLGKEIKAGEIWNPTVNELYVFHEKMQNTNFEIVEGRLQAVNPPGVVRYID